MNCFVNAVLQSASQTDRHRLPGTHLSPTTHTRTQIPVQQPNTARIAQWYSCSAQSRSQTRRSISIPLGRPFSIADSDIDVEPPLDVDESCRDITVLEQAASVDPTTARLQSTTLTAFLHILRLRRIESSIQQTIYRVDQTVNVTSADVDFYLEQLQVWKNGIPLDAKSRVDEASIAFDGYDYYVSRCFGVSVTTIY